VRPADAEEPLATPRRPPFDPLSAPPDPAFADPGVRGAPIDSARLTTGALRSRFRDPPEWFPEPVRDDKFIVVPGEPRPAAVLVPLVVRADAITVLLTERTAHLMDHAGQISFPGGRLEGQDSDAAAAALRETEEEIGITPVHIEPVGFLSDCIVRSGYRISPLVAWLLPGFTLRAERTEVAEILELPLSRVLEASNYEARRRTFGGIECELLDLPFGRHRVWGATAGMLLNLRELILAGTA